MRPAQLLITGDGPEHGQTLHLAPAVLYKMEHIHSYLLDLPMLFRETGRAPEEACIQVWDGTMLSPEKYIENITVYKSINLLVYIY